MLRYAMTILAALALTTLPALADGQREPVLGDDGLHKAPWMQDTFRVLREDLEDAEAQGKRLLLMIEQRGCIYCKKMHEEVFVVPEIDRMLSEDFYVVQINMFGDVEVVDFDGAAMSEKDAVRRWGAMFTPTLMFFPESAEDIPSDATASDAAIVTMPGAFSASTTRNLLTFVLEKGYETDEPFQKYHARKLEEREG
ncbi:thioredoxin family protein [Palleronia pelagia]|uniref:Thioredoxin-related protein n=1 Tax=Palleronia pelagia TaxID=387096 RepID=A0A1H8LP54_9RHOB|nr:thioredoxin family protein [Palleronia pelagia]SEO06874.1 Thioredoxin-related protein [Palleronia pelagia]